VRIQKLPVTTLLEERINQWIFFKKTNKLKIQHTEFELGTLSKKEIQEVLKALEANNALGRLKGSPLEYQIKHFEDYSGKDLLVSLREITENTVFDEIVRDEFDKIPSAIAKMAYVYASVLGQIDLPIRYETLVHVLNISFSQLESEIMNPTEGILISGETTGSSRHNLGFNLRVRHPIIASIIYSYELNTDEQKFAVINKIIQQLDPGNVNDRQLLDQIVRKKELLDTFASNEQKRAIYESLSHKLPGNAFVYQHRSILERKLQNGEMAVKYARDAINIDNKNGAFQNTLGLALEFMARKITDARKKELALREAEKLFEDGILKNPEDPYGYQGRIYIIRQRIQSQKDQNIKKLIKADLLSLIDEALEATNNDDLIQFEHARYMEEEGGIDSAIEILSSTLKDNGVNTRARGLLIELEINKGNYSSALDLALEGTIIDPASWRMWRFVARLQEKLSLPEESIKSHYLNAIRLNKGDVTLLIEMASFLFRKGNYSEANTYFSQASDLPIPSSEKTRYRFPWTLNDGTQRIFKGKITSIKGAYAILTAIPEGFSASFLRTKSEDIALTSNDIINFNVFFNSKGAIARIL
jgi:hypothetical protein